MPEAARGLLDPAAEGKVEQKEFYESLDRILSSSSSSCSSASDDAADHHHPLSPACLRTRRFKSWVRAGFS
uniref:Uncharacterized protein n=1 Tax=Zea mays TaxID=4577 RepID=A0A804Q5T7_MAIZE